MRYAAKLGNLYPSDPVEALKADSISDLSADLIGIYPILMYHDCSTESWETSKTTYLESLPRKLQGAEHLLGSHDFYGGNAPVYADYPFFSVCDNIEILAPGTMDAYPKLKAWMGRMAQQPAVIEHFKARPKPGDKGFGRECSYFHKHMKA